MLPTIIRLSHATLLLAGSLCRPACGPSAAYFAISLSCLQPSLIAICGHSAVVWLQIATSFLAAVANLALIMSPLGQHSTRSLVVEDAVLPTIWWPEVVVLVGSSILGALQSLSLFLSSIFFTRELAPRNSGNNKQR